MRTPEGDVKNLLRRWLELQGAYAYWPVPRGIGRRTIDVLACIAGVFVGIECKAHGEQPTALQEEELHKIEAAGGLVMIATIDRNGSLLLREIGSIQRKVWLA